MCSQINTNNRGSRLHGVDYPNKEKVQYGVSGSKDIGVKSDTVTETRVCSSPPIASASRIRSRFLNSLGFGPRSSGSGAVRPLMNLKRGRTTVRPLKESIESTSTLEDYPKQPQDSPKKVSFFDVVTVHHIPAMKDYSNRMRNLLWVDPVDMRNNASRNITEFAYENWNWRESIEERDMVLVEGTGELVHPVHFMRQCNLQRHFFHVFAAQNQRLTTY